MNRSTEAGGSSQKDIVTSGSFQNVASGDVPQRRPIVSPQRISRNSIGDSAPRPRIRSIHTASSSVGSGREHQNNVTSSLGTSISSETHPSAISPSQDAPAETSSVSLINDTSSGGVKLSIAAMLEAPVLSTPGERKYVKKLVEMHDIDLQVAEVPRTEWGPDTVIVDGEEGGKALQLPPDLRRWDIPTAVEVIDIDTFEHRPEGAKRPKEALIETGVMLEQVGIYLGQRVAAIDRTDNAGAAAVDVYRYGKALQTGELHEASLDEVQGVLLTPEQTATVDRWFGFDFPAEGEDGNDAKAHEQKRVDTLSRFFDHVEKATLGSAHHAKVVDRIINRYMHEPRTQPEVAFGTTLFHRGQENVITQVGKDGWKSASDSTIASFATIDKGDLRWKTLREIVDMQGMKDAIKDAEQQDVSTLSEMQVHAALYIQKFLSSGILSQGIDAPFPAEILEKQQIACTGASTIGSGLLTELGIQHLVVTIPNHSLTVVITPDGLVHWHDFLNPRNNFLLTDDDIQGTTVDGKPITTQNLRELAQSNTADTLVVEGISDRVKDRTKGTIIDEDSGAFPVLSFSTPPFGLQDQINGNLFIDLLKNEKNDSALVIANQLAKMQPGYYENDERHGHALFEGGQYDEAEDAFTSAIAKNQISANSRDWRSFIRLHKLGDKEGALHDLDKALVREPDNTRILARRATIYYEDASYAAALIDIERLMTLEPDNVKWVGSLGAIQMKQNDFEAAIETLEVARVMDPEHLGYMYDLANAYTVTKRFDEALVLYSRLVEKNPTDDTLYRTRGNVHLKNRNFVGASSDFAEALTHSPDEKEYILKMGEAVYYAGDLEKALDIIDTGMGTVDLNDHSLRAEFLNSRFVLLDELGRQDEAITSLELALQIAPKKRITQRNYGRVLTKEGRIEEAKTLFTRLLEQDPEDIISRYEMAKIFLDEEDISSARHEFELAKGIADFAYLQKDIAEINEVERQLTEQTG